MRPFVRAGLQRRSKVCPRCPQRRPNPEQHGGDRRQDSREGEHPRIDARIHDGHVPCREPEHEILAPPGKDGAADPAEDGQQEGLGQQLPNHAPAARAECQAHRDLAAASGRAHQQEVREIHTLDQQDGGDDGEHHGQDLLGIDAGTIGSLCAGAHAELWKPGPRRIWRLRRARRPAFTHRLREAGLQFGERLFPWPQGFNRAII